MVEVAEKSTTFTLGPMSKQVGEGVAGVMWKNMGAIMTERRVVRRTWTGDSLLTIVTSNAHGFKSGVIRSSLTVSTREKKRVCIQHGTRWWRGTIQKTTPPVGVTAAELSTTLRKG